MRGRGGGGGGRREGGRREEGFEGDDAMCVRTQLEANKWPGTLC